MDKEDAVYLYIPPISWVINFYLWLMDSVGINKMGSPEES